MQAKKLQTGGKGGYGTVRAEAGKSRNFRFSVGRGLDPAADRAAVPRFSPVPVRMYPYLP